MQLHRKLTQSLVGRQVPATTTRIAPCLPRSFHTHNLHHYQLTTTNHNNNHIKQNEKNEQENDEDDDEDDDDDDDDYRLIAIDRSKLVQKTYSPLSDTTGGRREAETAMIRHLKTKIKGSGPMSLSTFMHESLLNPKFGYYYTGGISPSLSEKLRSENHKDENAAVVEEKIFGASGDFVTSPEISSMFGEMIGVWCLEVWNQLNRPRKLQIVELGPGRGTLMHDLLHSISVLGEKKRSKLVTDFLSSTEVSVHMVEASPQLRQIQQRTLQRNGVAETSEKADSEKSEEKEQEKAIKSYCDIPVTWHSEFEQVPDLSTDKDAGILVLAHEFFDALPVFQFQYTDRGWCEVLVDVNDDESSDRREHFKYVLAPSATFSNILIELSPVENKLGNRIEISPASMGIMEQIGMRLQKQRGASLIIDYGKDEPMGFTLMGIKNHQFTETPLESPGEADLSVFVDFSSLRFALEKFDKVKVWGVQNQSHFLYQMGIDVRLLQVLRNPDLPESMLTNTIGAFNRLTSDSEMGRQYQVMCVTSPLNAPPAGFELAPKPKPFPKRHPSKATTSPTSEGTNPQPTFTQQARSAMNRPYHPTTFK